ncbi:MAG: MCE family protein, partial [Alphaproteobacteria bacterium]|nr:MCE family protein [Alphaproteobacteria bacterium]
MQHNPNRDVLVGAVGVAVLAGLFAFSYAGKDLSSKANVGTYPVAATFDRIDGLVAGDEVRLGGIRVGTVGMPTLDASYRAVVTLNIQNEIRIPVDSAAAIHTDGLFG